MIARIVSLALACVIAAEVCQAQDASLPTPNRLYRMSLGFEPRARIPSGFAMSASMDLVQLRRAHLLSVVRLDATSMAFGQRNGLSAITADVSVYSPWGPSSLYGLSGAGLANRLESTGVIGVGYDYSIRGRPVFTEGRSYISTRVGVWRMGVRF